MNRQELYNQIQTKRSYLCVGLDPDLTQVPSFYSKDAEGLLEFNREIIEATKAHCIAYKLNLAFYECLGVKGWELFEKTLSLIPSEHFVIADAKRGDIGNTSFKYAKAFFDSSLPYRIDALTVNPYMGRDSVLPFLSYSGKWVILLALTSNDGANDFQKQRLQNGNALFEEIIGQAKDWGSPEQVMFVTGATQASMLKEIRKILPDNFLLVPGIGAQGGSLENVSRFGMNESCGLLVNVGRSILYASKEEDFAERAAIEAQLLQQQMAGLLKELLPSSI